MNRQTQPRRIVRWILSVIIAIILAVAGLKLLYPLPYRAQITRWTEEYTIDPYLEASIIRTESHFRKSAVSRAGAIGLMQIMPSTGEWIATKIGIDKFETTDLYDPETNIRIGTWYLRYLIDRFGDVETALIAYNAGPGNAERWRASDDAAFPETAEYLRRVKDGERVYRYLYTLPVIGPIFRVLPH